MGARRGVAAAGGDLRNRFYIFAGDAASRSGTASIAWLRQRETLALRRQRVINPARDAVRPCRCAAAREIRWSMPNVDLESDPAAASPRAHHLLSGIRQSARDELVAYRATTLGAGTGAVRDAAKPVQLPRTVAAGGVYVITGGMAVSSRPSAFLATEAKDVLR